MIAVLALRIRSNTHSPIQVYEEEVLGTDAASWFSPDGKYLAFIRFDDTDVREAVYDLYGEKSQYPESVHLKYPKVRLIVCKRILFNFDF